MRFWNLSLTSVCVLLCFIKPILENPYVQSQVRRTHDPRSPTSHRRDPGVTGSSPSAIPTSLATPIPSSCSLNGPTTTTLTTTGLCPGGSVVWASPKFVGPHRWGYWVMIRFFWDTRSQLSWNPPTTQSNTCLFKKKNPKGEGAPAPEKPSLSHYHYGNTTELGSQFWRQWRVDLSFWIPKLFPLRLGLFCVYSDFCVVL